VVLLLLLFIVQYKAPFFLLNNTLGYNNIGWVWMFLNSVEAIIFLILYSNLPVKHQIGGKQKLFKEHQNVKARNKLIQKKKTKKQKAQSTKL
jgi:hypothetical protein